MPKKQALPPGVAFASVSPRKWSVAAGVGVLPVAMERRVALPELPTACGDLCRHTAGASPHAEGRSVSRCPLGLTSRLS